MTSHFVLSWLLDLGPSQSTTETTVSRWQGKSWDCETQKSWSVVWGAEGWLHLWEAEPAPLEDEGPQHGRKVGVAQCSALEGNPAALWSQNWWFPPEDISAQAQRCLVSSNSPKGFLGWLFLVWYFFQLIDKELHLTRFNFIILIILAGVSNSSPGSRPMSGKQPKPEAQNLFSNYQGLKGLSDRRECYQVLDQMIAPECH